MLVCGFSLSQRVCVCIFKNESIHTSSTKDRNLCVCNSACVRTSAGVHAGRNVFVAACLRVHVRVRVCARACMCACMTFCQCTYPVSSFALRYAFACWLLFIPTTVGGCWAFPSVHLHGSLLPQTDNRQTHLADVRGDQKNCIYVCACASDPFQSCTVYV